VTTKKPHSVARWFANMQMVHTAEVDILVGESVAIAAIEGLSK